MIRLFGINNNGNSVCLLIENFFPYFYVKKPEQFTSNDIEGFKNNLSKILENSGQQNNLVKEIEIVEKTNVFMYTDKIESYLKIVLYQPKNVATLRDYFEKNLTYQGIPFERTTYESKINFPLRFMIDRNVVGMSWIRVKHNKYKIINNNDKISHCQIEAWCDVNDVEPLSTQGEYSKIAPLRILSIDIECAAEGNRFPQPDRNPIIQISNICIEFGKNNDEPIVQKLFSYKKCADIVGVDVLSYEDEKLMLKEWRDFVIDLDPDIITGYNINMFDFPYLLNRAEYLKVPTFNHLSRVQKTISKVKHKQTKVKGFMNRDTIDINLEGRILLDMYTYIIREHKLRSYSLNNVSFQFLNEQKEDVHHSLITSLWEQNEYSRRRLAVYCMKDAYLPLKLMEHLMTLFNYTEMCRVTSTPLNFILTRGQQIKVSTQLHKKAKENNFIIPVIRTNYGNTEEEEGFEGAFVLTPTVGFHSIPIVTLDFSSLYPSIMIAHNLCYTTLLKPGEEKNLKEDEYIRTPNGDCFVTEKIRKGLLPTILEELLAARKTAKKEMNNATDPFLKNVLNGRQLALKVSCNSVYGFTGTQNGSLPCLQISSSVTAFGREMIEKTRDLVIGKYNKAHGYAHDASVIYGDTDSVMIKFGVETLHEAMELGRESSEFVTSNFKKPIKIEFEKVFYPYLLLKKKKYAGVIWTKEDKYDKIDTKGLEAVRRDNCELVRMMVETVIKKILVDKSIDDAVNYCKGIISDLLQNRIDISLLIISKSISKKSDEENEENNKKINKATTYTAKQAHVELAEKMKKRDAGTAPNIGDRVQYVIIKGEKGTKNYQNSEDPLYALEHDLPIDIDYYLENQIKKPLLRIFDPILKDAEMILFHGEHTRIKTVGNAISNKSNSAFGKFLIIKKTCMHCKSVINSGVVCKNCKKYIKKLYFENRIELNYYERLYCDLWTQCQKCQGFVMQDIICQNKDCPIFYKRFKVKKDIENYLNKVERFNEIPDW